jgi:hypothetical protein
MSDKLTEAEQRALAAYEALLAMSDMLDQMATQARLALGANPTTDERRDLEAQLLDIAGRKAVVEERITLIKREHEAAPLPPPEAVAKVATLVQRVERETAAAMRADAAIKLGTDVLALANQLAT